MTARHNSWYRCVFLLLKAHVLAGSSALAQEQLLCSRDNGLKSLWPLSTSLSLREVLLWTGCGCTPVTSELTGLLSSFPELWPDLQKKHAQRLFCLSQRVTLALLGLCCSLLRCHQSCPCGLKAEMSSFILTRIIP